MSRSNITHLPLPLASYNPEVSTTRASGQIGFEPEAKALAEDETRVRLIRKSAGEASDPKNRAAALTLAYKLDYQARQEDPPESCASRAYMRAQRKNIGGGLWKLADDNRRPGPAPTGSSARRRPEDGLGLHVRSVTIMREDWEMPVAELLDTHPSRFLERLRVDLYACGAAKAKGAFICGLHGEYNPATGIVRVHVHGIAFYDMARVIDRLRKLPGYAPIKREIPNVL